MRPLNGGAWLTCRHRHVGNYSLHTHTHIYITWLSNINRYFEPKHSECAEVLQQIVKSDTSLSTSPRVYNMFVELWSECIQWKSGRKHKCGFLPMSTHYAMNCESRSIIRSNSIQKLKFIPHNKRISQYLPWTAVKHLFRLKPLP